MQGSQDAFNDVSDIGVVAARGAVAKYRDRLARFDQTHEFIDRQVRPLAWAIDREEAQA